MEDKYNNELKKIFRADQLTNDVSALIVYSRDLNPLGTIFMQEGKTMPMPDIVVWPETIEQIQKLVVFANEHKVPLIPYGSGSGVCGGANPVGGGIIVDMKRMNRIRHIDPYSLVAEVESGIIGELFERELNAKGYTLGHFPSSIWCSTVGGWLAARSAGQLSSRYGKIEDMVLGIEAVMPDGDVLKTKVTPRSATGPDFKQLLVGSEGTLGIITSATLRINRYPESRRFNGIMFHTVKDALDAIRELMQTGIKPAAVRLYDEIDTFMIGSGKGSKKLLSSEQEDEHIEDLKKVIMKKAERMVLTIPSVVNSVIKLLPANNLLILTFEGTPRMTEAEQDIAVKIMNAHGGKDLGEEPGKYWWEHRYDVSFNLSPIYSIKAFADTIEVATTWDKLLLLYEKMRNAIGKHALVMAHFSHVYQEGGSIYFTFAASTYDEKKKEALYRQTWKDALDTAISVGATISHHHGIGMLKAQWMDKEHGKAMEIYRQLKTVVDPNNIMNPGKMGL